MEAGNRTMPSDKLQSNRNTQAAFRTWLDGYLNLIIGTAFLGGQITFTVILTDIADPATIRPGELRAGSPSGFSKETVRLIVSLSWLCFTAALGLSATAKLIFSNALVVDANGHTPLPSSWVHGILTLLLNGLSVGAFLLLSLAVTAYVPIVGWVGVAVMSTYLLGVIWLWLIMNTGVRNSFVAPIHGPFRPEGPGVEERVDLSTCHHGHANPVARLSARTM